MNKKEKLSNYSVPKGVLEDKNKIKTLNNHIQNLKNKHSTNGLKYLEESIKKHMELLKEKYFVKRLGIFGSYSRGEETPESDIDILVEFSAPVGLEFIGLKNFLENILSKNVDLVTENGIRPHMKNKILDEVVFI